MILNHKTRTKGIHKRFRLTRTDSNASIISSAASRIIVLVVPTDEERVIAVEALQVLKGFKP